MDDDDLDQLIKEIEDQKTNEFKSRLEREKIKRDLQKLEGQQLKHIQHEKVQELQRIREEKDQLQNHEKRAQNDIKEMENQIINREKRLHNLMNGVEPNFKSQKGHVITEAHVELASKRSERLTTLQAEKAKLLSERQALGKSVMNNGQNKFALSDASDISSNIQSSQSRIAKLRASMAKAKEDRESFERDLNAIASTASNTNSGAYQVLESHGTSHPSMAIDALEQLLEMPSSSSNQSAAHRYAPVPRMESPKPSGPQSRKSLTHVTPRSLPPPTHSLNPPPSIPNTNSSLPPVNNHRQSEPNVSSVPQHLMSHLSGLRQKFPPGSTEHQNLNDLEVQIANHFQKAPFPSSAEQSSMPPVPQFPPTGPYNSMVQPHQPYGAPPTHPMAPSPIPGQMPGYGQQRFPGQFGNMAGFPPNPYQQNPYQQQQFPYQNPQNPYNPYGNSPLGVNPYQNMHPMQQPGMPPQPINPHQQKLDEENQRIQQEIEKLQRELSDEIPLQSARNIPHQNQANELKSVGLPSSRSIAEKSVAKSVGNSSVDNTLSIIEGGQLVDKNHPLYQIQMEHLQKIAKLHFEVSELEQEQKRDNLRAQLATEVKSREKELEAREKELKHEEFVREQKRKLMEAKVNKQLADAGLPTPHSSMGDNDTPRAQNSPKRSNLLIQAPYLKKNGMALFFDYVVGLEDEETDSPITIAYQLHDDSTDKKTPLKRLGPFDPVCLQNANFVVSNILDKVVQISPKPSIRLIIVIENDEVTLGWFSLPIFTNRKKLIQGSFKIPLVKPPIQAPYNIESMNRRPRSYHMLFMRVHPAQVMNDIISIDPEDPFATKDEYVTPPGVHERKSTMDVAAPPPITKRRRSITPFPLAESPNKTSRRNSNNTTSESFAPQTNRQDSQEPQINDIEEDNLDFMNNDPISMDLPPLPPPIKVEEIKEEKPKSNRDPTARSELDSHPETPKEKEHEEQEEEIDLDPFGLPVQDDEDDENGGADSPMAFGAEENDKTMGIRMSGIKIELNEFGKQHPKAEFELEASIAQLPEPGCSSCEPLKGSSNLSGTTEMLPMDSVSHMRCQWNETVDMTLPKPKDGLVIYIIMRNDDDEEVSWAALPFPFNVHGFNEQASKKRGRSNKLVNMALKLPILPFPQAIHQLDEFGSPWHEGLRQQSLGELYFTFRVPTWVHAAFKTMTNLVKENIQQRKKATWIPLKNPPAPKIPFLPGDGIDIYVDGARYLPDSIAASKTNFKIRSKSGDIFCECDRTCELDSLSSMPQYNARMECRQPQFRASTTLMCRVDGYEMPACTSVIVGFGVLNLFIDAETGEQPTEEVIEEMYLNSGQFQLSLNQGYVSNPLTVHSLDGHMHVPGSSILIRIVHVPKLKRDAAPTRAEFENHDDWLRLGLNVPAPKYYEGRYDSTRSQPFPAEFAVMDAKQKQIDAGLVNKIDSFIPEPEEGGPENDATKEERLGWITKQLPTPRQLLSLHAVTPYRQNIGFSFGIERVHGLKQPVVPKAIISMSHPGGFYESPKDASKTFFTHFIDWDSPQIAPHFTMGMPPMIGIEKEQTLAVIIELKGLKWNRKGTLSIIDIGWTIFPLFNDQGYTNNGSFQLPVLQGSPDHAFIQKLKNSHVLNTLRDEYDKGRKSKAKLVSGCSLVVHCLDRHLDGNMALDEGTVSKFMLPQSERYNYEFSLNQLKGNTKTLKKLMPSKLKLPEAEYNANVEIAKQYQLQPPPLPVSGDQVPNPTAGTTPTSENGQNALPNNSTPPPGSIPPLNTNLTGNEVKPITGAGPAVIGSPQQALASPMNGTAPPS